MQCVTEHLESVAKCTVKLGFFVGLAFFGYSN